MTESKCAVCGRAIEAAPGLCDECEAKTGLPPYAPPLRPPAPCERCGHREIVRVRMRERTSTTTGNTNDERARPLALTWELSEEYKAIFSFDTVRAAAPMLGHPYGLVEAYVCRACGATELFTREPANIPIGPEYGTELLVVPGVGYR